MTLCHASCATILIWLCIFLVKYFLLASLIILYALRCLQRLSNRLKSLSFRGSAPNPAGGLRPPPRPPALGPLPAWRGVTPCIHTLLISTLSQYSDHITFFLSFFVIHFSCITHHFICPQVSPTTTKLLKSLSPNPARGAQTAPSSRAAADVARCDALY